MCGIVGVVNTENAAESVHFGLFALQHRGQEAAGIASSDGKDIHTVLGSGEVSGVFEVDSFERLPGGCAIGHTRYSTAGGPRKENIQPITVDTRFGKLSLVHNGNLTNQTKLRKQLQNRGSIILTDSDSELVLHLLTISPKAEFTEALVWALQQIEGAYNFLILRPNELFIVRDPDGYRPLSIGQIGKTYLVASESVAFDMLRANKTRDVEPGEVIRVTTDGFETVHHLETFSEAQNCSFELAYFARPDSVVFGRHVYKVREEVGRLLAFQEPADADIVVAVPDSGVFAADGYAEASGLPVRRGLIRNHYVGRTFIQPTDRMRKHAIRIKLNPVPSIVEGKRIVLVDDSIVRGNTSRRIVRMLRSAGASEVHMRIATPPTIGPCFYGMDTPRHGELIAANHTIEEIRVAVEADTLAYISLPNYKKALGNGGVGLCFSCHTNEYKHNQDSLHVSIERRRTP